MIIRLRTINQRRIYVTKFFLGFFSRDPGLFMIIGKKKMAILNTPQKKNSILDKEYPGPL